MIIGRLEREKAANASTRRLRRHQNAYGIAKIIRNSICVIANALSASVTPQTAIIDPNNKVVYFGMPDNSLTSLLGAPQPGSNTTYLANALSQALAGRIIAVAQNWSLGCKIERQ